MKSLLHNQVHVLYFLGHSIYTIKTSNKIIFGPYQHYTLCAEGQFKKTQHNEGFNRSRCLVPLNNTLYIPSLATVHPSLGSVTQCAREGPLPMTSDDYTRKDFKKMVRIQYFSIA